MQKFFGFFPPWLPVLFVFSKLEPVFHMTCISLFSFLDRFDSPSSRRFSLLPTVKFLWIFQGFRLERVLFCLNYISFESLCFIHTSSWKVCKTLCRRVVETKTLEKSDHQGGELCSCWTSATRGRAGLNRETDSTSLLWVLSFRCKIVRRWTLRSKKLYRSESSRRFASTVSAPARGLPFVYVSHSISLSLVQTAVYNLEWNDDYSALLRVTPKIVSFVQSSNLPCSRACVCVFSWDLAMDSSFIFGAWHSPLLSVGGLLSSHTKGNSGSVLGSKFGGCKNFSFRRKKGNFCCATLHHKIFLGRAPGSFSINWVLATAGRPETCFPTVEPVIRRLITFYWYSIGRNKLLICCLFLCFLVPILWMMGDCEV